MELCFSEASNALPPCESYMKLRSGTTSARTTRLCVVFLGYFWGGVMCRNGVLCRGTGWPFEERGEIGNELKNDSEGFDGDQCYSVRMLHYIPPYAPFVTSLPTYKQHRSMAGRHQILNTLRSRATWKTGWSPGSATRFPLHQILSVEKLHGRSGWIYI